MKRSRKKSRAYDNAREIRDSLQSVLLEICMDWGEIVDEAWREFVEDDVPVDSDDPDFWIFTDYLLWHLQLESDDTKGVTMPTVMVNERPDVFADDEVEFVKCAQKSALSFFDVVSTVSGKSITVRDAIVGDEFVVTEKSASKSVEPGDILFGSVLSLPDLNMFLALANVTIPPRMRLPVEILKADLLEDLPDITRQDLRSVGIDLMRTYREIMYPFREPLGDRIRNADGDRLEIRQMRFDLTLEPAAAAKKLASLDASQSAKEILEGGRSSNEYQITWSGLPRNDEQVVIGDFTVRGFLLIEPGKIIAGVNSEEREAELRGLIESLLGNQVKYRATSIESMEYALNNPPDDTGSQAIDPTQHPELLEALQMQIRQHYEQWPDSQIPALGGATPREAAGNPELRPVLEGLLVDMGRRGQGDPVNVAPVGWLREELGMPAAE